jgi:hypothetical protein
VKLPVFLRPARVKQRHVEDFHSCRRVAKISGRWGWVPGSVAHPPQKPRVFATDAAPSAHENQLTTRRHSRLCPDSHLCPNPDPAPTFNFPSNHMSDISHATHRPASVNPHVPCLPSPTSLRCLTRPRCYSRRERGPRLCLREWVCLRESTHRFPRCCVVTDVSGEYPEEKPNWKKSPGIGPRIRLAPRWRVEGENHDGTSPPSLTRWQIKNEKNGKGDR